MNYYNELDPYPAQWLRSLRDAGHIPAGYVDERDIKKVKPDDLTEYNQCHFFAGIGGWPYALRLAGWPDDRPVWTGSCPCQPFSAAGKRGGADDPRHLWPEWFKLIRECRPNAVFGEQVASKDGLAWLDIVYDDLESAGYSVAAFDLCAAGAGAPHIRQRLYFVAESIGERWRGRGNGDTSRNGRKIQTARRSGFDLLGNSAIKRNRSRNGQSGQGGGSQKQAGGSGIFGLLADADSGRQQTSNAEQRAISELDAADSFWSDVEWLQCRDGKARPTQPGLFPLAHGIPARVGRLRAYGNAIAPPLAALFVQAYMDML